MALVSLVQAKAQLKVTGDDDDNAVHLVLEDAEAIVLDFLKARSIAIASVSVANPTVITTSVPHSLVSGVTAPIAGTTTTPTVNGAQVVTVTGATTFTVPVNVTVGQSAAAGTVGSPAWTESTVPGQVRRAILLALTHYHENPGQDMKADPDAWQAITRLLERSRDPALA